MEIRDLNHKGVKFLFQSLCLYIDLIRLNTYGDKISDLRQIFVINNLYNCSLYKAQDF